MTSRAAPGLQETIHHRWSFGRRGREGGGQHGGAEWAGLLSSCRAIPLHCPRPLCAQLPEIGRTISCTDDSSTFSLQRHSAGARPIPARQPYPQPPPVVLHGLRVGPERRGRPQRALAEIIAGPCSAAILREQSGRANPFVRLAETRRRAGGCRGAPVWERVVYRRGVWGAPRPLHTNGGRPTIPTIFGQRAGKCRCAHRS